jgi:hypothetical protein
MVKVTIGCPDKSCDDCSSFFGSVDCAERRINLQKEQKRRAAIAYINIDYLADLLQLPKDLRVTDARCCWNRFENAIAIRIEGDSMPEVIEGQELKEVKLLYEKSEDGKYKIQAILE